MSRHTVTGGADFFEGVFFTTLIAYFLKFGQFAAIKINGEPVDDTYLTCGEGVDEWYVDSSGFCEKRRCNNAYLIFFFLTAGGIFFSSQSLRSLGRDCLTPTTAIFHS